MRIEFHDNIGSRETMYCNPSISFYNDGSVVINETEIYIKGKKYDMPLFAGESKIVWADVNNVRYSNNERGNAPNAFKILWVQGNVLHFVRYKDNIIKQSFWKRLFRRFA